MKNQITGMVGIGKVENGRMTFVTSDGKGFSRPVSTTVSAPVATCEVRCEEIDVPSFMKGRKKERKVIPFPTEYKGGDVNPKAWTADEIEEQFTGLLHAIGKGLKKAVKPVAKHLFDVYEEE